MAKYTLDEAGITGDLKLGSNMKPLMMLATIAPIFGGIANATKDVILQRGGEDEDTGEKRVFRQRLASKQIWGKLAKEILLTGDNPKVAAAIATELGINKFFAQVNPSNKASVIKDLQKQGVMDETGGIPISEVLKDNVIPFKPRDKKFKGGIAGLLKRLNPQLEKDMVKTGPFQTGHRADMLGDMQQIKNRARDEKSGLEVFDEMEDMIIDSPRYNEAAKGAFMKLIDYEKFRAMLLDDNIKLQNMMEIDPEGTEGFIQMLYKREGSQSSMFATGGIVNTLAAPQTTVAQRNAMTNEDFFNMQAQREQREINDPRDAMTNSLSKVPYNITAPGHSVQTSDSFMRPLPSPENQMGQLPINQERAEFLQTPTGQGFVQIGGEINNLGQALGRGQQQIQQQIEQMNSGQGPISSLQSQNVLNLGGLGNLFGTRSSYGN